ncbi:MAG: hypothetical protein WBG92_25560 [Thiohalocapsa sp.]
MKIDHAPPSPEATRTREALCDAVANKLDEKRRLGHYYVIWRDGRAELVGPDAPSADVRQSRDAADR